MVREAEEGSPPPDSPPMSADAHTGEADEPSSGGGFRSQPTICKPDRNAMIAVAVIDEHSFTRECIANSLRELCNLLDIAAFATCDECLRSPRAHDVILYHAHESVAKPDNDQHIANIKELLKIAPVIILCDVDCIESVLAAFDSGVRGYIPTASTTPELAVEIVHLVKAGGTFVPPSSLSARGIGRPSAALNLVTIQPFTDRQMAVLDRLKLGKTNKVIAHELEVSESTIKVHIRNIMKKLKATNRTEVACRVHELETRRRD